MRLFNSWLLALATAGLVSASAASTRPRTRRSCSSSKNLTQGSGLTQSEVSRLYFYRQWAGSAYCNDDAAAGSRVVCSLDVCPDIQAHNATVVGSLSDKTFSSIEGFVGIDTVKQEIVLAFRGSVSIRNWVTDLSLALDDCDEELGYPDCKVHSGFRGAWQDTEPLAMSYVDAALAQYPNYTLVLTGHSLGGAAATVAAAYLRKAGRSCDLYTYGSPRVGNEAFALYMGATAKGFNYRVTHFDDPVPQLPPASALLGSYRHTSPEYWIMSENSTTTPSVSDIQVCPGTHNESCNAGTGGLDISAHSNYFGSLSACGNITYQLK